MKWLPENKVKEMSDEEVVKTFSLDRIKGFYTHFSQKYPQLAHDTSVQIVRVYKRLMSN